MDFTRFASFRGVTLAAAFLLGGCATADRKVTLLYQPALAATGGTGSLTLSASVPESRVTGNVPVQWVVGKVRNSWGNPVAEIVSKTPPQDLLMDALQQELTRSGYTVVRAAAPDPAAAKGVDVTRITMEVDEESDLVRSEATAQVGLSLHLLKGGREVKRLDYQAKSSDFAVKDRAQLAARLLQTSLQEVMRQAVPEMLRGLESPGGTNQRQ